jgi:hypothetical protein
MEKSCSCPDPALCKRLKRHIHGRLWEIWNNIKIDEKTAESYRQLWERQAGLKEELPKGTSKRRCNCHKKT